MEPVDCWQTSIFVKACEDTESPHQGVNVSLHSVHKFTPFLVLTRQPVNRDRLRKKLKVEITDDEGTTYSLSLQGRFSQDKVLKIMELMDLLGDQWPKGDRREANESTTYGKLLKLIESTYATKEFSSADIARDYEEHTNNQIPLSTVSTYLARLADRGALKRQKFGNSWVYRLSHLPADQVLK